MLEQQQRTPTRETAKLSSYRQKRAEIRHVSTSSSNTKDLQELAETVKSSMRRRGLSQSYLQVQPETRSFEQPIRLRPAEDLTANKLIQKYSNSNFRIPEVFEDEVMLQQLGDAPTAKKERVQTKPVIKKSASFLVPSNKEQGQRSIFQVKPEAAKTINVSSTIPERKTVVKGLKPSSLLVQPTGGSKTDRKQDPKKGIGLAQPNKDLARQLLRIEQLQDELIRGLPAEKSAQIVFHFANIMELLRDS